MNIRAKAIQWLKREHMGYSGIVCTSKYYVPGKSIKTIPVIINNKARSIIPSKTFITANS